MNKFTIKNNDHYAPQFSTVAAYKLIEKCLQAVETTDIESLLDSITDLAKLIQTANYDTMLLNNLISENQLLVIERDTLKLAQISNFVTNMELKLGKAERDCRDLQAELDEPEFLSFQRFNAKPTLRKLAG